jgi:hypothetical protein
LDNIIKDGFYYDFDINTNKIKMSIIQFESGSLYVYGVEYHMNPDLIDFLNVISDLAISNVIEIRGDENTEHQVGEWKIASGSNSHILFI